MSKPGDKKKSTFVPIPLYVEEFFIEKLEEKKKEKEEERVCIIDIL